jgi:putative heme degradation protein
MLATGMAAGRTLYRRALPLSLIRSLHRTPAALDYHFDTHHFVQRLEKEGLTRTQAEGIMSSMADVVDESIKNMASNMVTKADQEKVSVITHATMSIVLITRIVATIHPEGGFCATQVRTPDDGAE